MDTTPEQPAAVREVADWTPDQLGARLHAAVDEAVSYLRSLPQRPVLPRVVPGVVLDRLPQAPPDEPEAFDEILQDFREIIVPNLTHWQHEGFLAYFPSTACGPGIVGELLASTLNSNVMLWRNAPASTELEVRVVSWLRQLLGLPADFQGMFTDTASVSSLLSLAAARSAAGAARAEGGWDWRRRGWNDPAAPRLRMYRSSEAHSSIDKAAMTLGVGLDHVRSIEADAEFRMRPDRLREAIEEDKAAGFTPFAVVATIGTTSSTSVDPVAAIADVCEEHGVWLHVDAAYAGAAACVPELRVHFRGWERADSIVFNPHKWFFTPFDASLLLFRDKERFREAFRVVPEYLKTDVDDVMNFHEYGIQLGRRFRALKLWFQLRTFGASGMQALLRKHVEIAAALREAVRADPEWTLVNDPPFALVCLRWTGGASGPDFAEQDRRNARAMAHVNEAGHYFLSHTELAGRYTIRVAIGHPGHTTEFILGCFAELRDAARSA